MKVRYNEGIHLELDKKHILLDPIGNCSDKIDLILVSHGHWDHASGLDKIRNKTMIMHPATYDYKESYIHKSNTIKMMSDGEVVKMNGLTIEVHRSAHCVGSVQFKIIGNESTVIFTGDLNIKGTYIESPSDILKGDVLIIESNFGHPKYVFADRLETFGKFGNWIHRYINKKPIIIFCHALGKTQELTQFLSDLGLLRSGGNGERCNLFMYGLNMRTNQLFEKYRYRFNERYRVFSKSVELEAGEFLFYPIREKPSLKQIKKIKDDLNITDAAFAYVSGWTHGKLSSFYFPISSHSGFDELMEYVKVSGVKKVFSFHGYSETFAKEVNKLGIEATAITTESNFE